uniref:Outer membrane lipoprotein Blc n=1 Tax=Dechloromonas aromatica (strain RCB) TaxID=159087 RepID=Q47EV3_DECAR
MNIARTPLLAGLLAFALLAPTARAEMPAVQSVGQIDLARYIGKWYEIGAFPMFFQRQCIGDTTAEYSLKADGEIAVDNRCRTESGFDQAIGRAWVPETAKNAELKVSFFWPFRSDYWVIALDDSYRWAVVGNPNRKYLWLLSRTPRLPQAEIERALNSAKAQGYDLNQFKYTRHTETKQ